MSKGTEIRRIAEGETISVGVVHDFLLAVLHSDAICDVLLERMAFFDDCHQLDPEGLAALLPELVAGVMDVVGKEDWIVVAELLIEEFHEMRGRGGKER